MSILKRAVVFAVLALISVAGSVSAAWAQQQRLALVIGQSAYEGRQLATAANDAGLIAQALTGAGFEVVQGRDLNANDLRSVVRDFLDKAQALPPDAAVMVYLSGYGLQLEGENYLLPVDARIERDVDVPIEGFRLSDLVRSLERAPAQARIIAADMARDYPMPTGSDPLARGLALMDPPAGFLIAFSSAPNITIGDAPGPYGHYATALAEMMRQPGVPVDEVFNRVRLRTHETTKGLQTPWHAANLGNAAFVFFEPEQSASTPPPVREVRRIEDVPAEEAYNIAVERDTIQDYQAFLRRYPDHPLARRVSALLAARREAIVWRRTVTRNTSEAYWTYLRHYPSGPHAGDSRRRLARLSAPIAPPPVFDEVVYDDLPPPLPDVERIEVVEVVTIIHDAPPPPPPPVYLLPAYEEDEEFVTIIREPPPPPILVGVLPIPAPLPVPRYARPPRSFYEPIAPVTPRGPVAIPVAPPPVAGALFGQPGEPRPARGFRPVPPMPRQPGLTAEPQPLPVAVRPAMQPVDRVSGPEGPAPRLPSRPIPVPASVRPEAPARPAAPVPGLVAPRPSPAPVPGPVAPRPSPAPAPAISERPNRLDADVPAFAPRPALPAAPKPARPSAVPSPREAPEPRLRPQIERERAAAPRPRIDEEGPGRPRPPRPDLGQERPPMAAPRIDEGPARPRLPRPEIGQDRPAAARRLPRPSFEDDRPVQARQPRLDAGDGGPRPPRPAVQPRPAPQMQAAPRPAPIERPSPPRPRIDAEPGFAPQPRMVQPRPAPERELRPAAPAARPQMAHPPAPRALPDRPKCVPGQPCARID